MRVVGIAGSLREGSLNRALLRAAVEVAPPDLAIEIHDLRPIPLYDGDIDDGSGPAPVAALRDAIRSADGLLLVTPEYNYSIPGVLKNTLDWLSRPSAESVLRQRRVAITGVTGGGFGTVRAQLALRDVLHSTQSLVLARPELHVSSGRTRFDEAGRLVDQKSRDDLRAFLAAFASFPSA